MMSTMTKQKEWSTWFVGTEEGWRRLDCQTQKDLAFEATGCEVAYPTWEAPVDCLHTECRIRRGELPRIALTNSVLLYESRYGWLRFVRERDRKGLARIFRHFRREARATGLYDPWKADWRTLVYAGVLA